MAVKIRNGHAYVYRSVRVGKRVRSEYRGSGELAVACLIFDHEDAEARQQARTARRLEATDRTEARRLDRIAARDFRAKLAEADSDVARFHRRIRRLADAMLRGWGFHRHCRGAWRKARMTTALANHPDPAELASLVDAGDVRTLERVLYRAEMALYQRAEDGTLDRGGIEEVLLSSLGPGFGRVEKEAMLAQSRLVARDLAPPGSNAAEALMADRAALSWLEVRLLELDRADLLQQEKGDLHRLEVIDRMLSRASARLERAADRAGEAPPAQAPRDPRDADQRPGDWRGRATGGAVQLGMKGTGQDREKQVSLGEGL